MARAINSGDISFAGGALATDLRLAIVAGTNAAVAMLANRHYELDGSILTADRNYDLPVPSAVSDRIRVSLTNGNASWECVIRAAAGVTINGASLGAEWSRLFIAREYVEFRATSLTNWDVWDDGRIPQQGKMRQDTAQDFTHDTATKVAFDSGIKNVGDFIDLANDRFVPRRKGEYQIILRCSFLALPSSTRVIVFCSVNSALVDIASMYTAYGSDVGAYPLLVTEQPVAAGQAVEASVQWDRVGGGGIEGSIVSTVFLRPVFTIRELL